MLHNLHSRRYPRSHCLRAVKSAMLTDYFKARNLDTQDNVLARALHRVLSDETTKIDQKDESGKAGGSLYLFEPKTLFALRFNTLQNQPVERFHTCQCSTNVKALSFDVRTVASLATNQTSCACLTSERVGESQLCS
ncbi:hypothetical protein Poly59_40430 [Rubripirellula reticaptiva]|uniref:Uncharacterized protein n=2 Tax=Rubripirellula reticaptiva TaxID=2528013 RepID=A0A5C6EKS8_9BACT|nr:hypothetical protein Poly59_40430 [Rubripirellula reticaptiva]